MRKHRLGFRPMIVLIAVLTAGIFAPPATTGHAGDSTDTEVVIAGSGYMQQLLLDMVAAYQDTTDSTATFRVDGGGPSLGFQALCAGEADATMSTQIITDAQVLNCNENEVDFVELVVAVDHAVLVADADAEFECIAESNLPSVLRRTGELVLGDIVGSDSEDVVTFYGPIDTNSAYTFVRAALLSDLEPSVDETFDNAADISDVLAEADNSAIALMTYSEWLAIESEDLQLISVQSSLSGECIEPSPTSLSTGAYPASRLMYLYANAASTNDSELGLLLRYHFGATDEDTRPVAATANGLGFEAPVDAVLNRNLNNIDGPLTGRTFSRTENPRLINTETAGTINITGAASSSFATNVFYASFNQTYANVEIELSTFGDDAAWEAFCAGEVSVIQVSRPATDAELENCQVTPREFLFGADAVVVLASVDATQPTCLNDDQIELILARSVASTSSDDADTDTGNDASADATEVPTEAPAEVATEAPTAEPTEVPDGDASEDEGDAVTDEGDTQGDPLPAQGPTMWSEIAPEWAAENDDLPLLVLVPQIGAFETDLVLATVGAVPNFRRSDLPTVQETPAASGLTDIDYRIGATAITDGAITYMPWNDYINSPDNDRVQLVGIGDDCITPTEANILDGSYPFSVSARLVFAEENAGDPAVANLLWYMLNDSALNTIESLGLIGFDRLAIEGQRDEIFTLLENAADAAEAEEAEVDPDATETPVEDSATEEPTPEATEAPTSEPTEAVTEEATETATEAPTSEPTAEATEASTEIPTSEPTEEPTETPAE